MSEDTWLPEPTAQTAPYFDGAKDGKLRLQRCNACSAWAFPLKTICQQCGSSDMRWEDASGRGVLYSHAQLQRVYHPRHEGRLPITLAQIDTDEGVRIWSNLIEADDIDVKVGLRVEVAFETFPDGGVIPVFKPAAR